MWLVKWKRNLKWFIKLPFYLRNYGSGRGYRSSCWCHDWQPLPERYMLAKLKLYIYMVYIICNRYLGWRVQKGYSWATEGPCWVPSVGASRGTSPNFQRCHHTVERASTKCAESATQKGGGAWPGTGSTGEVSEEVLCHYPPAGERGTIMDKYCLCSQS